MEYMYPERIYTHKMAKNKHTRQTRHAQAHAPKHLYFIFFICIFHIFIYFVLSFLVFGFYATFKYIVFVSACAF